MTMQMNRMRRESYSSHGLYYPEMQLVGFGERDEVEFGRVGGVAAFDVLEGRLFPVDVYHGAVYIPADDVLAVGGGGGTEVEEYV